MTGVSNMLGEGPRLRVRVSGLGFRVLRAWGSGRLGLRVEGLGFAAFKV